MLQYVFSTIYFQLKIDSFDDVHPGMKVHFRVENAQVSIFENLAAESKIYYTLAIKNLQADFDLERLNLERSGTRHSLINYNNLATIKTWLESMAENNKNVSFVEFGSSVENRMIMALEIGTGSKENLKKSSFYSI